MKRDIYYTLRRQSIWVTVSGVLMGIPFLTQAVYFLLIRSVADVSLTELVIYMILPMAMEFIWCMMIHVVPLRNTVSLAAVSGLAFLMLMCFSLFYADLGRTLLATIAYVALVQLVVLILIGRFPYRLFGLVGVMAILALRVLLYTYPLVISADWKNLLVKELPGVCMLGAIGCVFGAIEPHKKDTRYEV